MKVLVTGNLGFIGSHLFKKLIESKIPVIGIDIINNDLNNPDICNIDSLDYKEITHVFHLAASKFVHLSMQDPETFIHNNCLGTCKIMQSFPNARIVNISSSSANEIKSIYGATKLFGEQMGIFHKNWLNLRLYNVFGEGQSFVAVVPNFIKCRIENKSPTIYGDGCQERDLTYVGDVVEELIRLMFNTKETGLIHLGYSDSITINDLCDILCPNIERIKVPIRDFDIVYSKSPTCMNITYGRTEGLKRTIEWYEKTYSRISE